MSENIQVKSIMTEIKHKTSVNGYSLVYDTRQHSWTVRAKNGTDVAYKANLYAAMAFAETL